MTSADGSGDPGSGAALPTVGVVSLTQGTRPDDLAAGLASLAAQTGVVLDTVVVGNGWAPTGLRTAPCCSRSSR